jgi:acyl-CoA thioester hydrolase
VNETITIRVRYVECDPMGVAHHSVYPVWFEIGRTELLRSSGVEYALLERDGILLAVVTLEVKYRRPARYDDQLALTTTLVSCGRVKIEHRYELRLRDEVLATARTVLACLNTDGTPREVPSALCAGGQEP